MKDLKGLYSALLIPFDENGEVKEEGLRQVIEHNINVSKIDGLYVNGSSGENFLLNTAQKKQIFIFFIHKKWWKDYLLPSFLLYLIIYHNFL